MAYSEKENIINKRLNYKGRTELMTSNARKSNSKLRPDGFLYFIKLNGHDIYKIGVSSNIKRRLYDIDANSPFGVTLLNHYFFKNVYEMEEMIHDNLKDNKLRKEWFKLDKEHLKLLTNQVKELSEQGVYLIRK